MRLLHRAVNELFHAVFGKEGLEALIYLQRTIHALHLRMQSTGVTQAQIAQRFFDLGKRNLPGFI